MRGFCITLISSCIGALGSFTPTVAHAQATGFEQGIQQMPFEDDYLFSTDLRCAGVPAPCNFTVEYAFASDEPFFHVRLFQQNGRSPTLILAVTSILLNANEIMEAPHEPCAPGMWMIQAAECYFGLDSMANNTLVYSGVTTAGLRTAAAFVASSFLSNSPVVRGPLTRAMICSASAPSVSRCV